MPTQVIPAEIEIDGTTYTVTNATPKPVLAVGDFVRTLSANLPRYVKNEYGKVLHVLPEKDKYYENIGVEFPRKRVGRHDLQGNTKPGHGYYLAASALEKVD